jgi:hypothetical protein
MKTHQTRPLREEMQDLYAIALREHGAQGRSTRLIARTIESLSRGQGDAGTGSVRRAMSRASSRRDGPDSRG